MNPVRTLRITGGPRLHTLKVFDAETGQEIYVRGVRITGNFGTPTARQVEVEIRMPATVDVVAHQVEGEFEVGTAAVCPACKYQLFGMGDVVKVEGRHYHYHCAPLPDGVTRVPLPLDLVAGIPAAGE